MNLQASRLVQIESEGATGQIPGACPDRGVLGGIPRAYPGQIRGILWAYDAPREPAGLVSIAPPLKLTENSSKLR